MHEESMAGLMAEPSVAGAFFQQGFAVIDLLDAAELEHLFAAYRSIIGASERGFYSSVLIQDEHKRLAVDQAIRPLVALKLQRLLPGCRLCFCTYVSKSPESESSAVPLHQDWTFVDESRYTSVGLWCPLVDVTPENGCLEVVPGSHRLAAGARGVNVPFAYRNLLATLRKSFLVQLPVRAGQAVLIHPRLFHGSAPNRSRAERVVVGGVLAPQGAALRYYHAERPTRPQALEVFEVEDTFYLQHAMGRRPEGRKYLGAEEVQRILIEPASLPTLLPGLGS